LTELVLNLNRIVLLLTRLRCRDNQRNTQGFGVVRNGDTRTAAINKAPGGDRRAEPHSPPDTLPCTQASSIAGHRLTSRLHSSFQRPHRNRLQQTYIDAVQ